jgi:hypothetical protein
VRKPFRTDEILNMLTKHLGVRFVYEETGMGDEGQGAEMPARELSAADMAALPAEWVANLYQAAVQADAGLILDLLDRIREANASLADALASLVHDFRFDLIVTLTQERGIDR